MPTARNVFCLDSRFCSGSPVALLSTFSYSSAFGPCVNSLETFSALERRALDAEDVQFDDLPSVLCVTPNIWPGVPVSSSAYACQVK